MVKRLDEPSPRAVVLGEGPLAERSRRALLAQGLEVEAFRDRRSAAALFARDVPLFVLRAGAFPRGPLRAPPASATGRPVIAIARSAREEGLVGLSPEDLRARLAECDELPDCLYLQSPRGLSEA